jgi:uncharacterized membrane protein
MALRVPPNAAQTARIVTIDEVPAMSPYLLVHVAAASGCVILGAVLALSRKGTPRHRLLGLIWWVMMVAVALTSFGIRIQNPGRLSWIHLLSIAMLVTLMRAAWAIRHGDVAGHRAAMNRAMVGLALAGVAAVAVPGRMLNVLLMGWFGWPS